MPFAGNPTYSSAQLSSASSAASKYGVPVNIVRGVTWFHYGPGSTASQFGAVASSLAKSYSSVFKQHGNALDAWSQAAAQQMPGASSLQVAAVASNQAAAQNSLLMAPAFGLGAAEAAAADEAAAGADASSEEAATEDSGTKPRGVKGTGNLIKDLTAGEALAGFLNNPLPLLLDALLIGVGAALTFSGAKRVFGVDQD